MVKLHLSIEINGGNDAGYKASAMIQEYVKLVGLALPAVEIGISTARTDNLAELMKDA